MQSTKTHNPASECSDHDHEEEEQEKSGCTCGGECGRRLMLEKLRNQKPEAVDTVDPRALPTPETAL